MNVFTYPRQRLHASTTRVVPSFSGTRRASRLVIVHATKRADETEHPPLRGAAPAAEVTIPVDAADFGERRPCAAYGTVTFHPANRKRTRPAAAARVKKRNGQLGCDRLERVGIGAEARGGLAKRSAVLA